MVDQRSTSFPAHQAAYQSACDRLETLERLCGETKSLTHDPFTSYVDSEETRARPTDALSMGAKRLKRLKSNTPWEGDPNWEDRLNGSFRGLIPVSETPKCLVPAKLVKPVNEGRGRRPMQHNGHRNHQSQHGP